MTDVRVDVEGMKTIEASTRIDIETPVINIKENAVIQSKGATLNFGSPVVGTGAIQPSVTTVTATATGATTGIIPSGSSFVSVTSTNSAHIVKLPTPVLGNMLYIQESSAEGFNVIPAAATQFINGTLVDGTKKLAAAAGVGTLVFLCTVGGASGKRTQYFIDEDGTIDAGGTPS